MVTAMNTQILRGDGATPVEGFTLIAKCKRMSFGIKLDSVETTTFESPDGMKEKEPTLSELGDITFDFNAVPTHTSQSITTGLAGRTVNKQIDNYKIQFADGSYMIMPCFVSSWNITAEVGNILQGNGSLTPTRSFTSTSPS